MAAPTRNGPCPCGSGSKYKKCCLPEDEAAKALAPPGDRVVVHGGQSFAVSRNVSPDVLDVATSYFEAKDRGR